MDYQEVPLPHLSITESSQTWKLMSNSRVDNEPRPNSRKLYTATKDARSYDKSFYFTLSQSPSTSRFWGFIFVECYGYHLGQLRTY